MPEEVLNKTQITNLQNQTIVTPAQAPPENIPQQTSSKLGLKNLIVVGIVIITILVVVLGLFLLISQRGNKLSNQLLTSVGPTTISIPTTNPETALESPALYPEFEWKETVPTIPLDGSLLYADYESLNLAITGKEWHYSANAANFDEFQKLTKGFDDHYAKEIHRLIWDNRIEYNGKTIQALVADGPAGGIIGYSKIVGDKMRLIMLADNTNYKGRSTNERLFSCPCEIEFTVFVSDIFQTSELEK